MEQHWFVANLKEVLNDYTQSATEYREAAQGTSQSKRVLDLREMYADEGVEGLLQEASYYETIAKWHENWVALVEDMVHCGLEREAIRLYEARCAVRGSRYAFTNNVWEWTTGGIALHLECRLLGNQSSHELEKIYVTLHTMGSAALEPEFVDYYEQMRRAHRYLRLPAPKYLEE